ncbi:MAG: hypothetical protein C0507_16825 [Cyanobacteria bacterium PR.3.49]|nr:hypothetical protein [Cyanobacteria bacterium PR.3.49]
MAASPESNLVADIVRQAPQLGNIDHLAAEAAQLLQVHDFSQNTALRDGIIRDMSLEDDLLETLVWAQRDKLDVDDNGVIEVGEGNDLRMSDDIFVQLAAEFMSKEIRDYSFAELDQAARNTAAHAGYEMPTSTAQTVGAELPGGEQLTVPNVMQFNGEQPVDPNVSVGDPASMQGVQDPTARYKEEAQFLGVNFGSLDTDNNGQIDDTEFKAAISGSDITQLTALNIAFRHNLVDVQNDQFSSLSLDQVAADYFGAEGAAPEEGGNPAATSDRPAMVPEGTETEGGIYQFTGNQNAGEHPAYASEEHPAYAPDESSEDPNQSEDMRTLNSKNASTKDRLKAIARLVEAGKTSATITDSDGSKFDVRMEVVPVAGSSRTMVHMFATDPQTGKEFVVLRAIKDGEDFTRQRDESGNEVDFAGTRWRQNHPDSMFLQ